MAIVISDRDNRDLGLEQALLYHLMKSPQRDELLTVCYPTLFTHDETKNLFSVIKELHVSNDGVGVLSVAMKMEEKFKMNRESTLDLFNRGLLPIIADGEEPEEILYHLKQLLFRRIAFERLTRMASIVDSGIAVMGEEGGNLYEEATKLLLAENRLTGRKRQTVEEIAKSVAERINTTADIVRTGFGFINKRTGGLTRRHISSLLAMPGHCKSLFSDALMYATLKDSNSVGLIISLEDPVEERYKRIVANRLGISLADMRFKRVQVPQADILQVLKIELGGRLHIIDTRHILKPEEAAVAISDIKPSLAIVDHIQNFQLNDMVQGLISAARILEVASMRNDCHTMVCSQVPDKRVSQRDDPQPQAQDVQWTSALRQKSAEMFSLYYQYQDTQHILQQEILQFKILKARYAAAIGSFTLRIDPDKGQIKGEISLRGDE